MKKIILMSIFLLPITAQANNNDNLWTQTRCLTFLEDFKTSEFGTFGRPVFTKKEYHNLYEFCVKQENKLFIKMKDLLFDELKKRY